jgi:hypothetical protein
MQAAEGPDRGREANSSRGREAKDPEEAKQPREDSRKAEEDDETAAMLSLMAEEPEPTEEVRGPVTAAQLTVPLLRQIYTIVAKVLPNLPYQTPFLEQFGVFGRASGMEKRHGGYMRSIERTIGIDEFFFLSFLWMHMWCIIWCGCLVYMCVRYC